MKSALRAFTFAAVLAASPALAGAGHDHGPKYGGVVRELRDVAYELVARPDGLTLYVSDHGKPVPTQGTQAEAVIYAGNDKATIRLESAGENRMAAKGDFRVGVGVRVVLTVTPAGQAPAKITYKLK